MATEAKSYGYGGISLVSCVTGASHNTIYAGMNEIESSKISSSRVRKEGGGRLDLTKTDYKNEGQAIVYHASSYEIKIYDKIKDLE